MKSISLKSQLAVFLFCFLTLLSFQENSIIFFLYGLIALASSVLSETLFIYIKKKKLEITESSIVTGLIIGLVLSNYMAWWTFVLAPIFSTLSKNFLRIRNKHIFNPAAFGMFFVIVLAKGFSQWNGAYLWPVIIPAGLYFCYKANKLHLALAYFLTNVFILWIQSLTSNTSIVDAILYSNYFFILIMLIEPKTTPIKNKAKILFGISVAIISYLLYSINFPFDADLPALLMGNLVFKLFINYKKRKVL